MGLLALKRRVVGVPRVVSTEANRVSSVTEWVLQRQAERWRVTVKVNKIKAGNLRASVLHKQCHRRQGGSVKDKGGWEDYRVYVSISADVCVLAWIGWWDPHLLCEKYIVTEWWGSLNVSVHSVHTMLGQLCPVNWLKTAGAETVSTLAESAGTITCQSIMSCLSCTFYLHGDKLPFFLRMSNQEEIQLQLLLQRGRSLQCYVS